ncbi:hypothetical protein [Tamlana sp. I1]|uniref:hypothetical protein n=1 Tax=Tamlana sp. I1 TaxID=2762061 RepID=UPI00188F227F|nr:hypothetical protein [Tamlana sp. I1]
MKTNKLHTIKSAGFNTPKDYFETFEDKLFDKLKNEAVLNEKVQSGFKAPKNYFETLDTNILQAVEDSKKTTKVIPLFSKKTILYASTIAAAIALFFGLSIFDSKPSFDALDAQTMENYILNENISTSEIASLFTDEELNENLFSEHNFDDENLEEYLINHADIETLITE